jgi:hypothetical protein
MKKFIKSRNPLFMVCSIVVVTAITILMTALLTPIFSIGVAAFVVFGNGVNDKYGKAGAEINSHNAYGHYQRGYKIPSSLTNGQSVVRQRMTEASKKWKDPSVERESWVTYSENHPYMKRGRSIKLRANAWFNEFNIIAELLGVATIVTTAPLIDTPFPIISEITCSATTGPDSITVEPIKLGEWQTDEKILIYASRPLSPGVMSYKTAQYYLIGAYGTSVPAIDITENYEAKFGAISVSDGLVIWFEARQAMPTGEATIKNRNFAIISPSS